MRHHDLDMDLKKIESEMLDKENIALDYIIKVPKDKNVSEKPF